MSDYHIDANNIRVVRIEKKKEENYRVSTLYFKDSLCSSARAGQFVMVWLPEIDEIPLSLSTIINEEGYSSVTVKEIGEATRFLRGLKVGDEIGIRGPFGNGFELLTKGKALVIGGGIGMASLLPLIKKLVKHDVELTILLGVKSKRDIIFEEDLKNLSLQPNIKFLLATEDGSQGFKGLVTDLAASVMLKEKFNIVYSCGPEAMMHKIFILSKRFGIPAQFSLERIIRCAVGICGSCAFGPYRICRDGPIFSSEQLEKVSDFGRFRRDFSGSRVSII